MSELVDADALSAWVQGRLPGDGPVEVERLQAGHSNLTFVVRQGGREHVLRRPPQGPLLPTAHDVVREYRVMDLLRKAGTGVRVPEVVAVCEDSTVIGVPFYLMAKVDGDVVRDAMPAWLTEDRRREVGLDLVAALAEIHRAPYEPFVASGIGRPSGYLERQVRRWRGQREGMLAGGGGRELPDYDAVSAWLGDHLPAEQHPAVVHGDYKLDNVILGSDGRVAAVVDWEMATVGDPLADLGYLLSFWVGMGESVPFLGEAAVTAQPGWPTRDEMAEHYAELTGRRMTDLRFYVTLAVWKLAVLLEASYHRHLAGTTDDPFFAMLETGVPALLARARENCGA
ncbi:MAG: phosphotransferase family protein [Actinobacteria bacterium]|nr:phosphotransferase family protein [Actinomycetota bacterium]MCA1721906.1 phosphotransferase family protein [Actinomycetota bacterium]